MLTMNKIVLTACLALFSFSLQAAKPSIAVLEFDTRKIEVTFGFGFVLVAKVDATTKTLSDDLITYLTKSNKFSVVERDRLSALKKEKDFIDTGNITGSDAVKIGEVIGADYLVVGRIEHVEAALEKKQVPYTSEVLNQYDGKMTLSVRLIDSRGGKVVFANKFVVDYLEENKKNEISPDDYLRLLKERSVQTVVNGIVAGIYPLKVVKISGNEVYLNRGEGADFQVGSTLSVVSLGEALKDPDTGETLGASETEVGVIQVSEIQAKFSKATILSGAGAIKQGSVAKLKELSPKKPAKARRETPGSSDKPVNWN